jgi:putative intracellular protease/amidase
MKKKILFVVTSHSQLGNTGKATGYYLPEVAHPWHVLHIAGFEIDFVSPLGGKAPVDGVDLNDEMNAAFWNNMEYRSKIENTKRPEEVDYNHYSAIYYAGGHGVMWDFPNNTRLNEIAQNIYENGGIVAAVCHGPAGILNIKLKDGKYLVDGKRINSFTNEEEISINLQEVVPFMLETALIERGARFEKSGLWQLHVVIDNRVITGQNPQSAKAIGEAILEELK